MNILGTRIDTLTRSEVLEQIKKWLNSKQTKSHSIVTLNPEMVMASVKNPDLQEAINQADLVVPDGMGIKWALKKLYKYKLKERIPGVDLVQTLANMSQKQGWRWYLIGGAPGVAKQAANKLKQKYPQINVVKAEDGGVVNLSNLKERVDLVERINKYQPDILVVSFGVPKQELFMNYFKDKLTAKIAIGAGGTLDFLAGKQKRAPKLLRVIGMEWFWRLIRQPKRFKRIWTATITFPRAVRRSKRNAKSN